MLYDARGKPLGKYNKEGFCDLLEDELTYHVVPKKHLEGTGPFAASRIEYRLFVHLHEGRSSYLLFLKDYKILIGEDVPERLRPVFAVHEYLHKKNLSHREMFWYELSAARRLGVLEDFMKFTTSEEAFRQIRKHHDYNREDNREMTEILRDNNAETWFELKDGEVVEMEMAA